MATTKGKFYAVNLPFALGDSYECAFPIKELALASFGATGDTRILIGALPRGITILPPTLIFGAFDPVGAALTLTLRLNNGTIQKPLLYQTTTARAGGVTVVSKAPSVETGIGFTTDSKLWWLELFVDAAAGAAVASDYNLIFRSCGWYPQGAVSD
jgi:hypothetical protein